MQQLMHEGNTSSLPASMLDKTVPVTIAGGCKPSEIWGNLETAADTIGGDAVLWAPNWQR